MTAELKKILTLKEIRSRREERLLQRKHLHARQCEHAEQALHDALQRSQEVMAEIQKRKHDRWQALFSTTFDSRKIMHAHAQDNEDAQQVLHLEASLRDLRNKKADSLAALDQAKTDYAQCVRKLEACNEWVTWHGRIEARRKALHEELLADEQQGARHGR